MLDWVILGVEVAGALLCGVMFALATTGREEFSEWERANLRRVAVLSGIGALVACALIAWHFV